MTQQSTQEVVLEGDLPVGQRPQPGRRPPREVWLGDRGDEGRAAAESGLWTAATPVVTAPPRSTSAPRQGAATRNVTSADGRRTKRRIMGVDVARGFALIGMALGRAVRDARRCEPRVHDRGAHPAPRS